MTKEEIKQMHKRFLDSMIEYNTLKNKFISMTEEDNKKVVEMQKNDSEFKKIVETIIMEILKDMLK